MNPDTPDPERPFRLADMAGQRSRPTGRYALVAGGVVALIAATAAITFAATRAPAGTPTAQQQTQPAAAGTNAAPTTAAAPTSPAAPAAGGTSLKFGTKADGPRATAIAYNYKQPVATKEPRPDAEGMEWGAADIEVCLKADAAITRGSWLLIYADHTTIDPSGTGYGGFPAPAYPWDEREVVSGECVRGWLTFAVPIGKKPIAVRYQPSSNSMRAEWAVA